MSIDRGDIRRLNFEVRDSEDRLTDPTELKLFIQPPEEGTEIRREYPPSGDIVREDIGLYSSELELDEDGLWSFRWETKGVVQVSEEGTIYVDGGAFDPGPDLGVYAPTVREIGQFMISRTTGTKWGDELGTFNEDTEPTGEQVARYIVEAYNEVSSVVGDLDQDEGTFPCIVRTRRRAKSAVIVYTAMLMEIGKFSEQIGTGGTSPFDRLERLYNGKMKTLITSVTDCVGGEPGAVGDSTAGMPSYNFGNIEGVAEREF